MKEDIKYHNLRKILSSENKDINKYLRLGVRNNEYNEQVISDINATLDGVPSFNNSVVFHCGCIGAATVDILAKWFIKRIGHPIQFPGFLSTTKDVDYYFKNQQKVFKIITCDKSNGKDITNLDFNKPIEGEITFKSGTFFKITDVKSDLITLEEIPEPPLKYEILDEDFFMEDEEIQAIFNQNNPNIKSLSDQNLI